MDHQQSPNIASFVLRFIQAEASSPPKTSAERKLAYRGSIRHIQSDQEITFTRWEDAVDFIQRFVSLESKSREVED